MRHLRSSVWLRKQQLWVLGIGALFVADFALCGYWPSHSRLQALRERRANYEQTIAIGRAKGAQLQTIRQRLSAAEETVSHYDAYVPAENSLAIFVREASELMTQHQLTDQVVMAGKESQAGELVCVPVHITGAGELKNVFGFFQGLRKLERLVRIDRATLKNDAGFSGRIMMDAEVIIYYRPGKTPAEGKAATAGGTSHGV